MAIGLILSCPLEAMHDLSNFNVLYLKILWRWPLLDFCTIILVYLQKLILFYQSHVNNCLKYKAIKSSCPFSYHLRPFLGEVSGLLRADLAFTGPLHVCSCFLPPSLEGLIWPFQDNRYLARGQKQLVGDFFKIQISLTCERYDRCSTVMGKTGLIIYNKGAKTIKRLPHFLWNFPISG